jgi:hypothetical protein
LDELGLSQIPMQCPHLLVLDLGLCGRMTGKVLELIGDRCTNLTSLSLGGAFLPTSSDWTLLLSKLSNLHILRLQYAAKLCQASIKKMVECCPLIEDLEIDDCMMVDNQGVSYLKDLIHLKKLSLNCIGQVDVGVMEELLSKVGSQLSLLSLNRYFFI